MMKILMEPPPRLELVGEIRPAELQPIIDKALAKKKEDRYQACSEISTELSRFRRQVELATQLKQLERERDVRAELEKRGPGPAPVVQGQPVIAAAGAASPRPEKSVATPQRVPVQAKMLDKVPGGATQQRPTEKPDYERLRLRADQKIGAEFRRVTFAFLGIMLVSACVGIGLFLWPRDSSTPVASSSGTPSYSASSKGIDATAQDVENRRTSNPSGTGGSGAVPLEPNPAQSSVATNLIDNKYGDTGSPGSTRKAPGKAKKESDQAAEETDGAQSKESSMTSDIRGWETLQSVL